MEVLEEWRRVLEELADEACANGNSWEHVIKQDVDLICAEMAAREARIAELEQGNRFTLMPGESLQKKTDINGRVISLCIMAANGEPVSDGVAKLVVLDRQQQAEPVDASHSEDGREAIEVVGHLLLGGPADQDELEDNDIDLDMKIVERLQVELVTKGEGVILALMTVAQHGRIVKALELKVSESDYAYDMKRAELDHIVAAKDAEIARLCKLAYIGEHEFDDCTYKFRLEELRAQPARQVGEYGDAYQGAREGLAIWKRRALEAEETICVLESRVDSLILDAQGETRMGGPVIPNSRQVGGDAKRWALGLYNEHGGYSPKMVDPETLPNPETRTRYVLESDYLAALAPAAVVAVPETLTYSQGDRRYVNGWNDALSHIGSAIPLELLWRAVNKLESAEYAPLWDVAQELRALLGKEG